MIIKSVPSHFYQGIITSIFLAGILQQTIHQHSPFGTYSILLYIGTLLLMYSFKPKWKKPTIKEGNHKDGRIETEVSTSVSESSDDADGRNHTDGSNDVMNPSLLCNPMNGMCGNHDSVVADSTMIADTTPSPSARTHTMKRIQLFLEASNLKSVVRFGRMPSPYVMILLKTDEGDIDLGRTESIPNESSPRFTKVFHIDVDPTKHATSSLLIQLFNENLTSSTATSKKEKKRKDKMVASASVELYDVVNSDGLEGVTTKLDSGGSITIYGHESKPSSTQVKLQLRGLSIKNIEKGVMGLGKTDPFFSIAKLHEHDDYPTQHSSHDQQTRWQVIYRSKAIMDHLNPLWEPFELNLEELVVGNEDLDQRLQITLWDWEKRGKHREIGRVQTTLKEVMGSVIEKGVGNADKSRALRFNDGKKVEQIVGYLVVLKAEMSR